MKKKRFFLVAVPLLLVVAYLFVLAATFFTGGGEPATIAQDKSVCAAQGIGLNMYIKRWESASSIAEDEEFSIRYISTKMVCQKGQPLGEFAVANCSIGTTRVKEGYLILVETDGEKCVLSDYTNSSYSEEGPNWDSPYEINIFHIFIGVLIVLAVVIIAWGIKD